MPGRPRILSVEVTHDHISHLSDLPDLYLEEIQEWLTVTHDVPMSISALHRHIVDCRITYKMLHKATPKGDEELWAEWRVEHQDNWVFFFFFEISFYIPGHNGSPVTSYAQVILQLPTHASNYET
jgi:hypothetical protein